MPRYETYDEIKHVAVKHYNDDRFCVVAALTVTCQVPYGKAFNTLKKLGRRKRRGTYTHHALAAIKVLGCKYKEMSVPCSTINQAENFFRTIKGHFLVSVPGHMLSIRDGVIMDWTAGTASRRRIQRVWQITKE